MASYETHRGLPAPIQGRRGRPTTDHGLFDEEDPVVARQASLEERFVEVLGDAVYRRLLAEQWVPFAGEHHSCLTSEQAVAREVGAARAFLDGLSA